MCGVAGIYRPRSRALPTPPLQKALRLLEHRGPDDSGSVVFEVGGGYLALGHTRLSIIDLTEAGRQPMVSSDNRYTLVFNGEIYNFKEIREELFGLGHRFVSQSDSEVLLKAWQHWGRESLKRLIGMFAFGVFDNVQKTLTLARDAFGIKPLFYSHSDDQFLFASEISALTSLSEEANEMDEEVMTDFLLKARYDKGNRTFLRGVSKLLPGHYLTVNFGSDSLEVKSECWWLPRIEEEWEGTFVEAAEKLRGMFLESVQQHLRSDVRLGFALSGGIDSSSIVSAVRYLEPDIDLHTFSFVAPGTSVDEEFWVDIVNSQVRAIPHKVQLAPEGLATDIDDMIRSQGEPFGDTSIYAQYGVYRAVKESGITVTLDGQGADELLAGYNGYVDRRLSSLLEIGRIDKAIALLFRWSRWPGRSVERSMRAFAGSNLSPQLVKLVKFVLPRLGRDTSSEWLLAPTIGDYSPNKLNFDNLRGRQLVAKLREELISGELQGLLRHGDRNSMRWSVESRVPFLTLPLAEFVLSLPEHFLLSEEGRTKHIFREAMRGIVSDRILDRRDKIGFQPPEGSWLSKLQKTVENEWLDGLELLPMVDVSAARRGIKSQLGSGGMMSSDSWRFINAAKWAQIFIG